MKICPKCKKQKEQGTYCTQCGESLIDVQENMEFKSETTRKTEWNDTITIKKPSVIPFAIIFIIVSIACCFVMGIIQKKAETGNSTTSNEDLMEWMQNTFSDDKSSVKDEDDNNNENQYTDENNQENYENQENFNNDDIAQQYLLPDSNSRYLTKSDIRHLSKAELRLARNEIYARHGRKFADETLQAYFDSQDWYSGIISPDNFSEDVLNDYERKNAELISNYEVEMGYK